MNKSIKIVLITITSLFINFSFAMGCHEHKDNNENTSNITHKLNATIDEVDNELVVYVCPMHPEEVSEGESNCSICGMALEKTVLIEE